MRTEPPGAKQPQSRAVRIGSKPPRATGALVLCLVIVTACPAWELVKLNDRDYVTLESVKEFYSFDEIVRDQDSVTLSNRSVLLRCRIGRRECSLNNVNVVLGSEIEESEGRALISRIDLAKLLDPILRPHYISGAGEFRTVILDPGHGGEDRGHSSAHGSEAGYALLLAGKLKPLLEEQGFKVVLTRADDSTVATEERIAVANQVRDKAVFVSLHFSRGQRDERGIRTFRMAPVGVAHFSRALKKSDLRKCPGNMNDPANVALALAVHASVVRRLGTNTLDRGVRHARFAELMELEHPAVRLECGFLSHPEESGLIHSEAYQSALVRGISDAILKYRHAAGWAHRLSPLRR